MTAVRWSSDASPGYCSIRFIPGAEDTTELRIVGTFRARKSPHFAPVRCVRFCIPCAKALSRPRPVGKESRAVCLPGYVLKRFRPISPRERCEVCLSFERAELLAVWRDNGCAIICSECLDGIALALKAVKP